MKKEIVEGLLTIKNGQPIIIVERKKETTNPEVLIQYIKKCVLEKKIKASTPKAQNGHMVYKYKIYDNNKNINNYLVIKIKHNERYLLKPIIEKLNEVSSVSGLITKQNITRFIAGIAIASTLLTVAGPTIAKGLKKLGQLDYEYDHRYSRYQQSATYVPTEKDRLKAQIQYYEDLRTRAQNGDESAIEEYNQYLSEQQLKQQKNEENTKKR